MLYPFFVSHRARKAPAWREVDRATSKLLLKQEKDIMSKKRLVKGSTRLETDFNGDLASLLTSWLSSFATTHLRAASRACQTLFSRNSAVATTDYLFLEQVAPPDLPGLTSIVNEPQANPLTLTLTLIEPQANPHSPLRCWRIALCHLCLATSFPDFFRNLFNERSFVLAAVTQDGRALTFAHNSLKSDRDVVLAAVTNYGYALEFVDESLQEDRDVVLAAVTQDGYALKFAHPSLKSDRDVVLVGPSRRMDAHCILPTTASRATATSSWRPSRKMESHSRLPTAAFRVSATLPWQPSRKMDRH